MHNSQDMILAMCRYRSEMRPVIVETLRQADTESLLEPGAIVGGFGDGSIYAAFSHLVDVEESWLHEFLLNEGFADGPDPARYSDFESIVTIWEQVSADWMAFLTNSDGTDLWQLREFPSGSNVPVWTVAWHVFNHTTHHTAEMWTALTAAGISPPEVEVMAWARHHDWSG